MPGSNGVASRAAHSERWDEAWSFYSYEKNVNIINIWQQKRDFKARRKEVQFQREVYKELGRARGVAQAIGHLCWVLSSNSILLKRKGAWRLCNCSFFKNFLWGWGLKSGFPLAKQVLHILSHTSSPFCSGYFRDGVSRTMCLVWPRTAILLISASQRAGITGMSHWQQAHQLFLTSTGLK
jgi:hypothetical protein